MKAGSVLCYFVQQAGYILYIYINLCPLNVHHFEVYLNCKVILGWICDTIKGISFNCFEKIYSNNNLLL